MIINLDELKREYEQLKEEYRTIEKYEGLKEEEYKCKMDNTSEKIKYSFDEKLESQYLYYRGLHNHHKKLRIEAQLEAEHYDFKIKNISEEDLEFPF